MLTCYDNLTDFYMCTHAYDDIFLNKQYMVVFNKHEFSLDKLTFTCVMCSWAQIQQFERQISQIHIRNNYCYFSFWYSGCEG